MPASRAYPPRLCMREKPKTPKPSLRNLPWILITLDTHPNPLTLPTVPLPLQSKPTEKLPQQILPPYHISQPSPKLFTHNAILQSSTPSLNSSAKNPLQIPASYAPLTSLTSLTPLSPSSCMPPPPTSPHPPFSYSRHPYFPKTPRFLLRQGYQLLFPPPPPPM